MTTNGQQITQFNLMRPAHLLLAVLTIIVMAACEAPSNTWRYIHDPPLTIALESPYPPPPASATPTPTVTPTSEPTTTPTPTITPFPTAQAIRSQAVAFLTWNLTSSTVRNGLRIANLDGSGERYLLSNVFAFRWSPDGTQLAVVARAGVWILTPRLDTPKKVVDVYSDEQAAVAIAWSPDSRWLSVWNQQQLQIISRDGAVIRDIVQRGAEKGSVISASWSPDSTRLALLQEIDPILDRSDPSYIRVANINTGQISDLMYYPKASIGWLAWSPDSQYLAYAHAGRIVEIIDSTSAKLAPREQRSRCGGQIGSLSWSNVDQWILLQQYGNGRYGHGTNCLTGWDEDIDLTASNRATTAVLDKTGRFVYLLSSNFAPDDPSARSDVYLLRYAIKSKQMESVFPLQGSSWGIKLSPDGRFLARLIGGGKYTFEIIDLKALTRREYSLLAHSFYREYGWSSDSRQIIYEYTPIIDDTLEDAALFALDIETGVFTRLTGDYQIEQWAVAPASQP